MKDDKVVIVKVNALRHGTISRNEVNATHLWYDVKTKKMHTFYGGQLKFTYANKETQVSVDKLYITKKGLTANIWKIRQWFDENSESLKLEIVENNPSFITFAYKYKKSEELESLESELYSNRFDYEVDKVNA